MTGLSLVTGGAGFVGARLVAALRARGERVRVLDLSAPEAGEGIETVQGSVTDPDAARAACEGVDAVFHLAGNAQLWARDPGVFERVNLGGTRVMLSAARAAGVRKFVQCSSLTTLIGRATPRTPSEADESVVLSPDEMLGPYSRSKRLADIEVEAAAEEGFGAVIAMPTEPLGAGDAGLTPPTRMILDFVNGDTPAYIDCVLNFVPVDALAEGFIAARDRGERGERYLLGGENVPMAELLHRLEALTGRRMPRAKAPYAVAWLAGAIDTALASAITRKPPKAPLAGVRLAGRPASFSSEKAARALGWRAPPIDAALSATLDWFAQAGLLKR